MALMKLSDLLAAIETSVAQAQSDSHISSREYVNLYMSDEILRTFKVPNFEFDHIELDVPIRAEKLEEEKAKDVKVTSLKTAVVLKRQKLSQSSQKNANQLLSRELKMTNDQVQEIFARLQNKDVLLLLTSDNAYAQRISKSLVDANVKVEIEKHTITSKKRDLVVDTEQRPGETSVMLRIRLIPRPLRLVKDAEKPGDNFIIEPAD